jgi:hypothetical protein
LKVLERLTAAGLVTKKRAVREARELLEYHAPRTLAGDGVQEEVARGIPERRKRLMAVLDKVIKRNPDWEQRIAPKKEDKEKP